MARCRGLTWFVRKTMLGDEIRRCDVCGSEYFIRPQTNLRGPHSKLDAAQLKCSAAARRAKKP